MSVEGDGSSLTDKMFIGRAEFLLTTLLVSLMTLGSSPRVDQPLSISLGKFDGTGVARPDVYLNNLTRRAIQGTFTTAVVYPIYYGTIYFGF